MLKKKVVIVEDNALIADMLKAVIETRPDWQIVGTSDDGKRGAEVVLRTQPDLVLLDLILPGCDGFFVMETIRRESPHCKFFVISSLRDEKVMARAFMLGASFYMTKPFDTDILLRRISDLFAETPLRKRLPSPRPRQIAEWERRIKLRLYHNFLDLGVPVVQNGFKYLRSGIVLCANDPVLLTNISANVYPKVAKLNGVKPCVVERNCRYSLETAWRYGCPEYYGKMFKCHTFDTNKPTNGEFLRMMTDRMLMEFPKPDDD